MTSDNRTTEDGSLRFRKRPIEVEAWQWPGTYESLAQSPEWVREYRGQVRLANGQRVLRRVTVEPAMFSADWLLVIPTLEGCLCAGKGDWIIKGAVGEVYPCKPDVFEVTYEPA